MFGYPNVDLITPDLSGLYRIDHEAYHAGIGISSSKLKKALISYGHYTQEENQDTPAMAFGRAFHMAVLEPALFYKHYVIAPDLSGHGHYNSASYKAAKLSFEASAADKEILKPDQMMQIKAMHEALKKHPQWNKVLAYSPEVMGICRDPISNMLVKCKMDLFGGAIIDVKTTNCASEPEFRRSVLAYGYHISASFYQTIIFWVTGEKLPFIHIAVEKDEPFGVAFYSMSDEFLDYGSQLWRAALARISGWNKEPPRLNYGSSIRTLLPTGSVVYKTQEILSSLEG